ncbi:MAG: BamA/TamA family outer membrane protein [Bacteroidota bacterium]
MFNKARLYKLLITVSLLTLLLAGCTGLKSVSDGSHLYTGHILKIDSTQLISNLFDTKKELNGLFKVKPNSKFLWMRPKLCLDNMMKEPEKNKGFKHWLKTKVAQPPVLIESINLPEYNTAIENRLQNRGNFQARSKFEVLSKRKTAKVRFDISPGEPYKLKTIKYPSGNENIESDIKKLQPKSLLETGNVYNLKDFENERNRINLALINKGYYYFRADYLLFTADTAAGKREINTWLNVKPEIPAEATKAFRYKDIYIFDDYSLKDYHPDTTKIGNYFYVSEKHKFKTETILNEVFFEKDSLYSRTSHYATLQRLMGLGIYKFATANFAADDSLRGRMNVNVLLTPMNKISLSAELNGALKSNNFAGPGFNLNYKNRNFFRGAELLSVTLGGYFDWQYSGSTKGKAAYQLTLDATLTLPKFAPFNLEKGTIKSLAPKTIITAGGGTYNRVDLYKLHSFNTSLGYLWKKTEYTSFQLNLLDISYTILADSSEEFAQFLQENPSIKKSFEQQFILGSSFNFVNRLINMGSSRHSLYLNENLDLAGNFTSLVASAFHGARPTPEDPYQLLGMPYSQFAMLRNEVRYYYKQNNQNQLAWRLIAGVGVPYGNSSTIPYIKQYYVGGPYNIRAFVSKSIGPGTYAPADSLNNIYVDQTGDITLETSLEYRFGIYKSFKGALFVDAGNIWLMNDDPQRPGGKFNMNTFYKQLAVGAGYGFRFDFNFILLRFDLAVPLRKPYLPEGRQWVIDEIDFSPDWRRDNIMWNIAIGYPF